MKNVRKKLLLLLACVALLGGLFAMANGESGPGYKISGSVSGDVLTVTIATQGETTVVGRLGLAFDKTQLALLDRNGNTATSQSAWASVVDAAGAISLHSEDNAALDMFSVDGGYVLLTWYSSSTSGVKADTTIATLRFRINSGVTAADFSRSTLRLLPNLPEGIKNWDSAAYVWVYQGERYKYNQADCEQIAINFDYPNSAAEPSNARNITLTVKNSAGTGINGARVTVDGAVYTSGSGGAVSFKLTDGVYTATAEANAHVPRSFTLTVSGGLVSETVTLLTDAEGVAADAAALEIGYTAEGDNADRVTGHLILPEKGSSGTSVSWRSSNTALVTNSGAVSRPVNTEKAILTATVTRGAASSVREFELTFKGTYDSPEEQAQSKFTDLGGYDWAKDSIERLYSAGIIKGTSETTFSPAANISRADFILLLIRMLGFENESFTANFDDVPQGAYYYNALGAAKKLGIADGVGDNKFNPTAPITRQDMMTLCSRALIKLGVIEETDTSGALNRFSDADAISAYARDAVAQMVAQGFIKGDNNRINPKANTSRAETAVFLYRIYDSLN